MNEYIRNHLLGVIDDRKKLNESLIKLKNQLMSGRSTLEDMDRLIKKLESEDE